MTVNHDDGCANRPCTRVPRCTPTSLSHAIDLVDQSKVRRPARINLGGCGQMRLVGPLAWANGYEGPLSNESF